MSDFDEPAYPVDKSDCNTHFGLTIRQTAVLMAMHGIAAHPDFNPTRQEHFENAAIDAIRLADAVLRAERQRANALLPQSRLPDDLVERAKALIGSHHVYASSEIDLLADILAAVESDSYE